MGAARIVTVTLNTAIDRVVVDGRETGRRPGGKGINVSRVLAVLGTPSIATGLVGEGEATLFEDGVAGVEVRLIGVPGPTRINTTTLGPGAHEEHHVKGKGYRVRSEHKQSLIAAIGPSMRAGDIFVFAGSLPDGFGPAALRTMVVMFRLAGARIVIDTSGRALRAVRAEPMWLLKVNAQELGELTSMPTATQAQVIAAARSLDGAIEHICITRGADGAVLITPTETLVANVEVDPARVISTVGCGDAFLAGLLHGHAQGLPWDSALRAAVGTATAQAITAPGGIVDPGECAHMAEAARIRRV